MGNTSYAVQLIVALTIGLLVWGVLASPLLLGLYLSLRRMRRRAVRSPWAGMLLALVFSLLAAPVPTPILTLCARRPAPDDRMDQTCAMPPSTKNSMPLTKLACSDARNATAFATSCASPSRPSGTCAAR